jgi:integrase
MTRRFGTIRQRPSGRFQAIHEPAETGGRQITRTFDTEKEAEDWLAEERTRLRRGEWLDPLGGSTELTDFFETWITGRPLAPRTVELYRWLWSHCIAEQLGHRRLAQVTPSAVRSWHTALVRADRPGPTTVAKAYRLLSAVLGDAVRDGLIGRQPCTIVGAGVEPRRPVNVLAVDEIERLADCIEPRYRAMVLLAAYGGLRWGEITGLRVRDLHLDSGAVSIHQTLSERCDGTITFGAPKTAAGYRTVALPPSITTDLEAHLERYAMSDLVFTTVGGHPLRRPAFTRPWKAALGDAGLDRSTRFHDLRHTAATLATTHGATVREVQARLGHASPAAALRYQHLVAGRDLAVAAALDNARKNLGGCRPPSGEPLRRRVGDGQLDRGQPSGGLCGLDAG